MAAFMIGAALGDVQGTQLWPWHTQAALSNRGYMVMVCFAPRVSQCSPLRGSFLAQTSHWRAQHTRESACVEPYIRSGSNTGQYVPKHAWREK